jgi:hypothetical protein
MTCIRDRFVSHCTCVFLAAGAVTAPAVSQCEPTWDTTLGNPGISAGYIQPMVAWNSGSGEKIYVGGSATGIGGIAAGKFLATFNPQTGAWSALGSGIGQGSTNAFLTKILPWNDGTGSKLYVSGQFATAGGLTSANSLAVWNGSTWSGLGAGFTQAVARVTYDMLPVDFGAGEKLCLCGNWSQIGGVTAGGLAIYDPTGGGSFSPLGNGIGLSGAFSPFAESMILFNDGSGPAIYIAGRFEGVDGVPVSNVARYRLSTGQWESFGQPLIPTSITNNNTSWIVFNDGSGPKLYLGGQQFRINGIGQVFNVAKWNGSTWSGVGQVTSGRVTDLAVFDDGNGPTLYACGTAFFEVGYFAKLVNGLWEPVLGGGVNNPAVGGGFASAFGMYVWGDELLVGGNFSQVGGQDPTTGIGEGVPIPAKGLAAVVACGSKCPSDLDGDGTIGQTDLAVLLGAWGTVTGDVDGDGTTGQTDLALLLGSWGPC